MSHIPLSAIRMETVLSSTATSMTLTLTNLSGFGETLELWIGARTDNNAISDSISMRINGLSTSIYNGVFRSVDATNADSGAGTDGTGLTKIPLIGVTGNTAPANAFGTCKLIFPEWENTSLRKTFICIGGASRDDSNDSNQRWFMSAGLIQTTNAITSVTILPDTGTNLAANSFIKAKVY